MELHIEVIVKGQRASPYHSSQGKGDGAIIQQEVEQILLTMEWTHHPIVTSDGKDGELSDFCEI